MEERNAHKSKLYRTDINQNLVKMHASCQRVTCQKEVVYGIKSFTLVYCHIQTLQCKGVRYAIVM